MTEFTSHFPELAFYVNGARRQFIAGKYKTDVAAEVAVLRQLSDVTEAKSEAKNEVKSETKHEAKPEDKPKPKTAPRRKPSAK